MLLHVITAGACIVRLCVGLNISSCTTSLALRIGVALMHIPYTVEFINRKLTNLIDFKQVT